MSILQTQIIGRRVLLLCYSFFLCSVLFFVGCFWWLLYYQASIVSVVAFLFALLPYIACFFIVSELTVKQFLEKEIHKKQEKWEDIANPLRWIYWKEILAYHIVFLALLFSLLLLGYLVGGAKGYLLFYFPVMLILGMSGSNLNIETFLKFVNYTYCLMYCLLLVVIFQLFQLAEDGGQLIHIIIGVLALMLKFYLLDRQVKVSNKFQMAILSQNRR